MAELSMTIVVNWDDIKDRMAKSDIVEVVRCKDCKYCLIHDKILFCGYLGSIGEWRYRTETDYCSRGERKEVEE